MGHQSQQEHHGEQERDVAEVPEKVWAHNSSDKCWFYLGDTETGKVHVPLMKLQKVLDFFQGTYYSIFITIITLITLFSGDFRVIFFTTNADVAFSILTLCCMLIFFIEMVVFSFLKEGYFLKYYFWLDMLSTLTMLLDLVWITELLTGGNGVQTAASVAKVARASRASKIGAKATKLIRIIRLIRFLKLYKTASLQLAKQGAKHDRNSSKKLLNVPNQLSPCKLSVGNLDARSPNKRSTRLRQLSCINLSPKFQTSLMNLDGETRKISVRNQDSIIQSIRKIEDASRKRRTENIKDLAGFRSYFQELQKPGTKIELSDPNIDGVNSTEQIEVPNETRVGEKLKDEIQKNLITMILIILISIPLFNSSTWFENITSYQKAIYQLQAMAKISPSAYDVQADFFIENMMTHPLTLIYFSVKVNSTCCTFPEDYPMERAIYSIEQSESYRSEDLTGYQTDQGSTVVFQGTSIAIFNAQLNIGRTIFVCILLIISTLLFSRDVEIFALEPLENMFETVKRIALNPLNAIRQIEEKNMCIEAVGEQQIVQKEEQTQPNILENLIVKIGGLLAVGFGEAGTQIISRVIEDPNFVNVVIPGQKCMAIFGFCDIRNFTDATEILEADVMVFVNQIAEICHKVVNAHGGSPNKNIGDAFLLVWKYNQADTKFQQNNKGKNIELAETKKVKQIADLAVLSFVKMISEITKSYTLQKYKNNKLLKNRIKNYKGVKMGFGMHVGWAIEGPIGSQYKIDASYLSPSVNLASRLQGATKQYGIPMLITGQIYSLMTENKQYLRQVDRVMFDGYVQPTDLYTVDLHVDTLLKHTKIQKQPELTKKEKKYSKVRQNIKRNKTLEDIETKYITREMWNSNDIQLMRQKFSRLFYEQWDKGFNYYVEGEWNLAIQSFQKTQIMAPDHYDGPSQTLIKYMNSHIGQDGKAPQDWNGYRSVSF